METLSGSYDIVILGSGIAGLAAVAAHELGLQPIVLEKAAALGGGTVHSYGLIWVGQNYLANEAGIADTRDEVLAYMRFLGGGSIRTESIKRRNKNSVRDPSCGCGGPSRRVAIPLFPSTVFSAHASAPLNAAVQFDPFLAG